MYGAFMLPQHQKHIHGPGPLMRLVDDDVRELVGIECSDECLVGNVHNAVHNVWKSAFAPYPVADRSAAACAGAQLLASLARHPFCQLRRRKTPMHGDSNAAPGATLHMIIQSIMRHASGLAGPCFCLHHRHVRGADGFE